MNSAPSKSVRLDQLLFGYDQGHRLISGSMNPSIALKSYLSRISDSPGGSSRYEDGSVLRGLPIPEFKIYALMRTWPARHDQARPGTVWTHILLVGAADLGKDGIVVQLLSRFQHPELLEDLNCFTRPLMITESTTYLTAKQSRTSDIGLAKALLFQLYDDPGAPLGLSIHNEKALFAEYVSFSEIENLVISLWEQQWPRLRRGFSFMVGPWSGFDQNSLVKVQDLTIGFIRSPFILSPSLNVPLTKWLDALANDLQEPGLMRRFLKRAGADVNNPLHATRDLAKLYTLYSISSWSKSNYQDIVDITFKAFPEKSNAKWLKERVVDDIFWAKLDDFKINEYVEILFNTNTTYSLQIPNVNLSRIVYKLLTEAPADAMQLALDYFEEENASLAEDYLAAYIDAAPDGQLKGLLQARPALIHALIQRNPKVLERAVLWQSIPGRRDNTLSRLLSLPENMRNILDWHAITTHLFSASDLGPSQELIRQLPTGIVSLLLDLLYKTDDPKLYQAWLPALSARADVVIEWLVNVQNPPVDLLLWVVRQLEARYMWSVQLDTVWLNVGEQIHNYPESLREELAAHVLAILTRQSSFDTHILLNILEPSRNHICGGGMSYKLEDFLHDQLPRLKRHEEDWDLCRRLDKWLAKTLHEAGLSKHAVVNYFNRPKLAERLWRYLKKL